MTDRDRTREEARAVILWAMEAIARADLDWRQMAERLEHERDALQESLSEALDALEVAERERKGAEDTMCAAMEGRRNAIVRALAAEGEVERLKSAGNELAHWLQIWVDDTLGGPWCYSESALRQWQEATSDAS